MTEDSRYRSIRCKGRRLPRIQAIVILFGSLRLRRESFLCTRPVQMKLAAEAAHGPRGEQGKINLSYSISLSGLWIPAYAPYSIRR